MSHNPELVKQLAEAEIEYDGKTINEVLSLVNELKIGTEDLVNEWEAFAYNNKNDAIDATTINPRSFKIFSKHLRQTQSAKILKKSKSRSQGIHNVQTLKPLMENISKPNATNNSNFKSIDNQLDSFLSMTTPSKARPNKQRIISSANVLPQQPSQNIMQSPAFCKQSSSTTSQRRKHFTATTVTKYHAITRILQTIIVCNLSTTQTFYRNNRHKISCNHPHFANNHRL